MRTFHIIPCLFIAGVLSFASCNNPKEELPVPATQEGLTITAITNGLLPQIVKTRAEDLTPKNAEEKKINTLHLFFFDKEGKFLETNPQAPYSAYYRMEVKEGQPAALTIAEDNFKNQNTLSEVQVYAVANVDGKMFWTDYTPEYENNGEGILYGDKDYPTKKVKVTSLADLQNWIYRPKLREDISQLPGPGMPMVGLTQGINLGKQTQTIQINMKALMARIDVSVSLDANQTNHSRSLPTLQIKEYGVRNMPVSVPFSDLGKNADGTLETTYIKENTPDSIRREKTVPYTGRILHDQQAAATFTYYTYENIQNPDHEPTYPAGVDPTDSTVTQRWKRTIADPNASALVLKGEYVTHQGLKYQADFNVYMGSNTYNNFEVRRNRCYKNNISIRGLDYVRNDDPDVYTFDGRVNVVSENPIYISIVNERKLDAHWNVVPVDFYFLRREDGITDLESYIDVSLIDPNTNKAPDWIRMELVDSATMAAGKTGEGFIKGGNFTAGTGCREYFYTNLVTETLAANTSIRISGPDHHSRSRIYFYVDENASTKDRSVSVRICYNNKQNDKRERILELDQRGLLPVMATDDDGKEYHFYIEYYEEYIDHRDPLDKHEQENTYYSGLPWAKSGVPLAEKAVIGQSNLTGRWSPFNPCNVYVNGQEMTNYIFNQKKNQITTINTMTIYPEGIPASALHYAYAKNRRIPNSESYEENWYLPGIRELEAAISTYFGTFEEFQNNYYWSSATAKDPNTRLSLQENESATYARATMYLPPQPGQQTWVQSGSKDTEDNYTGNGNTEKGGNHGTYHSGRAPKTTVFRIRACRSANGVTN